MPGGEASGDSLAARKQAHWPVWLISASILVFIIGLAVALARSAPQRPLARLKLADGRILQIEAVTYGTTHRIGHDSFIAEHFGPWLPSSLRRKFEPKSPKSTIELERPGLVVWVNAINAATGTNVDCQGISTEFVDQVRRGFRSR